MIDPKAPGVHKFVRVNGEYRFIEAEGQHTQLVKVGETAESAGMVYVFEDYWRFADTNYSSRLGLGTDEKDAANLSVLIGKPQKEH